MARVIARVSGVALRPGVSKNRRLYTRSAIARMVADAQEQIESGTGPALTDRSPEPLTTLTHHAAGDDSVRIVGRVAKLWLDEDGNARFTADIANTPHGQTIANLLDTSDGQPPFLRNVSIRGAWNGPVRQIPGSDGEPITAGDAVTLKGIDFTGSPGVDGAQVDGFEWAAATPYPHPGESADGRVLIYESVTEALVTVITEEVSAPEVTTVPSPDAAEPTEAPVVTEARAMLAALLGAGDAVVLRDGLVSEASVPMSKRDSGLAGAGHVWADPGYQADKKQRYDISSAKLAKAGWAFINQKDNAAQYTAAQLKRVKGRIVKALKKFGITPAAEGWVIEPAFQVSEALSEFMGDGPSMAGSWSVCASNGPVCLNLSSYCMDPADLDVILRAAADAACKALAALDPDMDGDVDVDGAGGNSDTDGDAGETADSGEDALRKRVAERRAELREMEALMRQPPGGRGSTRLGVTRGSLLPDPAEALAETLADGPGGEPADESAAEDPATIPAAALEDKEEPAMSEPTPTEPAAGQAPAAASTAPATTSMVTLPQAALESLLADAVAVGRKQGKKERKAAERAAAATVPVPVIPAAPPAETAPAAPAVTEAGDEDITRLVREQVAAKLAAEGITAAAPVQETRDQMIARLVNEEYVRAKQDLVSSGRVVVERKGLTADGAVNEHRAPPAIPGTEAAQGVHPVTGFPTTWPGGGAKQPHEWTSEELTQFGGATLDHYVMGNRAVTTLP